jgi:SPP1 family predicted phage head-tail adaptor
MKAGRLNQRVIIRQSTLVSDGSAGKTETWPAVKTVWASVEPLSGRELLMAQASGSETTLRVRMRYQSFVTANKYRLETSGKTLMIVSVIDTEMAHEELVLECKEVT